MPRVATSAPALRERIARLETAGVVIRGYRIEVDLAARISQVSECYLISGEDCFLLKVHLVAAIEAPW